MVGGTDQTNLAPYRPCITLSHTRGAAGLLGASYTGQRSRFRVRGLQFLLPAGSRFAGAQRPRAGVRGELGKAMDRELAPSGLPRAAHCAACPLNPTPWGRITWKPWDSAQLPSFPIVRGLEHGSLRHAQEIFLQQTTLQTFI